MTIITSSDIEYYLSGGLTNSDPDLSLGGDISTFNISLERLFKNVTPNESIEGKTDYRCVYVKNNSVDGVLYQGKIYISYKATSDLSLYLGFINKNERQIIYVTTNMTTITGGYITLEYENANGDTYSENANWDSDDTVWATNIKNALNNISGLEDVIVSVIGSKTFQIDFLGTSAKRYHNILNAQDNLTYIGGTVTVGIEKNVSGSPINTTAELIDTESTVPVGVEFEYYNSFLEYDIGIFLPNEKIPVWIKRVVPTGAASVENDGITIRLLGETVQT